MTQHIDLACTSMTWKMDDPYVVGPFGDVLVHAPEAPSLLRRYDARGSDLNVEPARDGDDKRAVLVVDDEAAGWHAPARHELDADAALLLVEQLLAFFIDEIPARPVDGATGDTSPRIDVRLALSGVQAAIASLTRAPGLTDDQ